MLKPQQLQETVANPLAGVESIIALAQLRHHRQ